MPDRNLPGVNMKNELVIIGAGNTLKSDDGAGVQALRLLQADPPPGAKLVEAGTAVLDAVPYMEGAGMVVILDAVHGGGEPGQVYVLDAEDIQSARQSTSVHGFGLLDAFRLLAPGIPLPPATIIGVEPASLDYGTELSPAVAASLYLMAETARSIAGRARPPVEGVCP